MISKCLEVEEGELKGLDKEEPEEIDKVTYGNTTFRLLKVDGNYQIEKGNRQEVDEVVNIIDYTRLGISVDGRYNAEIENAFIRIKKARGHSDRFYREKKELALRLEDNLDLEDGLNLEGGLNSKALIREPEHLNKPITSVLEKSITYRILRKSPFITSDLDILDLDETV